MNEPFVIDCPLNVDDRGYVHCVADNMGSKSIQRAYIVENHSKGMLRAFHGHNDGFTYIHVISGAAKIAAVNIDDMRRYISDSSINQNEISSFTPVKPPHFMFTLSARKPQMVYVPANFCNGHLSLEDNTKLLIFSSLSFQEVKHDDERFGADLLRDIWNIKER